jgi:hypothetical protein
VSGGITTVSTDPKGRFEIPDLGPGTYYVAAWEDLDGGLGRYAPFVERFAPRAMEVALQEAGAAQVEVPFIPLASINEELEKF